MFPRLFQKAYKNRPAKPLKTNSRISPIRLFLKVWVERQDKADKTATAACCRNGRLAQCSAIEANS
jgi:hypothetical protein